MASSDDIVNELLGGMSTGTGGIPTLQEDNPLFAEQLQRNRAADERIIGQRESGQTAAEMALSLAGGGPLAGQLIKRSAAAAAKPLLTRALGGALGGATGAAVMPTQEGVTGGELLGGAARGATGELVGPASGALLRPLGRKVAASGVGRWTAGTKPAQNFTRAIDWMKAPFSKGLIPGAEETRAVFAGTGTMPTPGQLVDQPILDEFESMVSASVFGGARLKSARTAAEGKATQMIRGLVENFRTTHTPEQIGGLVSKALANSGKLHQRAVRGAYNSFKRKYGDAEVDIRVVNKLALRLESQLSGLKRSSAQARAIIKDVLDEGPVDKAAQEIFPTETLRRVGRGEKIGVKEAINLRSDLLTLERAAGDVLPGRTQATASGLARVLDKRIREGLRQKYGTQAVQEWRAANELLAVGKTGYNNRFIAEAIDTVDPEEIVGKVVLPGRSSRIRNVRTKVEDAVRKGKADPETWRAVQGGYLRRLLSGSDVTDPLTGVVKGQRLMDVLNDFGDEALREVFPGGSHVQLKSFARALATTQRGEKESFGGVAMRLAQFGAVLEVIGDPMTLFGAQEESGVGSGRNQMAGAILLGPVALSYVLTNPRSAKLLTTGVASVPGSATAKRAFGQLVSHLDEVLPEGAAVTNAESATLTEVPSIADLTKGSKSRLGTVGEFRRSGGTFEELLRQEGLD